MRQEIDAILSGVKDKAINKVGHLWQIRVGARAGARENGVSLARDLLEEHREDVGEIPPQPLTGPLTPATDYEAIIAGLKAQLAQALAPEPLEADDLPIPEFLKTPEPPPADVESVLAEHGLSPADSYERVNVTLIRLLTEAKGSAELARGYGGMFAGKSVVEWERKAQSINESIRWNAGRRVETI